MTARTIPTNYRSVVVCGLTGSGKSTLSEGIATALGFEKYTPGDYFRARYAELYPNGEISLNDYFLRIPDEDRHAVIFAARRLSEQGAVVIDTRLPNANLETTLAVRLVANIDIRVPRVASRPEYSGKPYDEVRELVRLNDQNDREFCQRIFGVNIDDPNIYHTTLNTEILSAQQTFGTVMALMSASR